MTATSEQPQLAFAEQALAYSIDVIRRNAATLSGFPERCDETGWVTVDPEPGDRQIDRKHWTDGFWVGLLWLAYAHTGDDAFERQARTWAEKLRWLRQSTATHDLGFVFSLSHVLGARLTGDASLLPPAVEAAATLCRRYNPRGEYLQAWGTLDGPAAERGRTNIDLMMNLELLFWASDHAGDPSFARIATAHARTSHRTMVRPDGSTAHCADFDPERGAFLAQGTHQGLSSASCWSRGQAWALAGFTDIYRWTGDPAFLAVARQVADYTLHRLPDDLVPFWDYDSPDIPHTYRDTSAAAVTASGLLTLAEVVDDEREARRWRDAAHGMIRSLWDHYSSRGSGVPAILIHGARSVPAGIADHGLIYGDYYFVEALTKLLRPDIAAGAFASTPRPALVADHSSGGVA